MMVTMLEFRGCRIRVSLLLPIVWMAALVTGRNRIFAMSYLSVTLHEAAHAAVLAAFRLPIHRVDLTPVGTVLACDAPETVLPAVQTLTALAGPVLNLALAAGAYRLQIWIPYPLGLEDLIRVNLALALFNLIPALPFDGGLILQAILTRLYGLGRAGKIMAWEGLIGCGLWVLAAWALFRETGMPDLRILFPLPIVVCACLRQFRVSSWLGIRSAEDKRRELMGRGLLPVKNAAVDESASLYGLLSRLDPGSYHIFTVIDEDGRTAGTFTEEKLLRTLKRTPAATARDVCGTLADFSRA